MVDVTQIPDTDATPLRALLQEAVKYEAEAFDEDRDVNGADLVDFFAVWREHAKKVLGIDCRICGALCNCAVE